MKSKFNTLILAVLVMLGMGALTACHENGNNGSVGSLQSFNLPAFPVTLTGFGGNGFGGMTLDRNDDLIIVGGFGAPSLYTIARADGALTVLPITGITDILISVVDTGTAVYVGTDAGTIYSVDTTTGAATLFATVGPNAQALAVAPAGFGAFGGQLIAGDRDGDVNAIDAVGAVTFIANVAGLTNLAFAADGTLYVTDDGAGNLSTVTAAGVVAVVAGGFGEADGIAINDAGGRIFVFTPGTGINSVAVPGGAVTFVNNDYSLDGGYWPTGAFFDAPGGDLFILTAASPDGMVETFKP